MNCIGRLSERIMTVDIGSGLKSTILVIISVLLTAASTVMVGLMPDYVIELFDVVFDPAYLLF
jgi:hypothetical protein